MIAMIIVCVIFITELIGETITLSLKLKTEQVIFMNMYV